MIPEGHARGHPRGRPWGRPRGRRRRARARGRGGGGGCVGASRARLGARVTTRGDAGRARREATTGRGRRHALARSPRARSKTNKTSFANARGRPRSASRRGPFRRGVVRDFAQQSEHPWAVRKQRLRRQSVLGTRRPAIRRLPLPDARNLAATHDPTFGSRRAVPTFAVRSTGRVLSKLGAPVYNARSPLLGYLRKPTNLAPPPAAALRSPPSLVAPLAQSHTPFRRWSWRRRRYGPEVRALLRDGPGWRSPSSHPWG